MKPDREPDDEFPPDMDPACAASLESLQRRLDGTDAEETAEVLAHRAACIDCQSFEESSRRLMRGLKLYRPESPPTGFADRVLEQFHKEKPYPSRGRSRWLAAGLALAASVLIAVFAIQPWTQPVESKVTITTRTVQVERNRPAPLGDSINEAGSAVVSLAKKTGLDSLSLKLPTLALPNTGPLDRLEPAVSTMQVLSNGAALSVAPLTNSARRAADVFWRELNGPEEMKPRSN